MKCLCCDRNFDDKDAIKKHYIDVHNVDSLNYFFERLFLPDRRFQPRKCFRYEAFFVTEREEKIHSFLNHYRQGGRLPTKFKPMTKMRYDENLEKYSINIDEHREYYNFENSGELIDEFMTVFKQKFVPTDGRKSLFKCSFTIVNSQPPLVQGSVETEDSRTWTTAVYDGVYFNDYIKFHLISHIKKRIIINGLTGSSWRFKIFDRLSISVNNFDDQRVLK